MTVKDHIKGLSYFTHYRKGYLFYETADTHFVFRVPIEDTGDASFKDHERSMTMMRYIRKELALQDADPSEEE